jgi:hypothetical protein
MAYSPNQKTVFRAGFGLFYSQIFSDLGAQVLFPGFTVSQAFNSLGTGIPQPFSLSQGMPLVAVQNLNNPQSTLSQYNPSNPLSGPAEFGQINPLPFAEEWNFGIQREIFKGTILDVNYAGTESNHLPLNLPFNNVPIADGTNLANLNTGVTTQSARPYPNLNGFSAVVMAGHSNYNALQISVNRQLASSLTFVANYTWSKSIDDGSGLFSFSQPNALNVGQFPSLFRSVDRALSEFDRTSSFTSAIQYRSKTRWWILRDWDIDPIITARTGLPTTVNQNNLNPAASQLRPNVISNTSLILPNTYTNGTGIQYLVPANAANFPLGPVGPLFTGTGASRTLVLPAGVGSMGRDNVRTPGDFDLDLALDRRFKIRERAYFELRAEAFNFLNHTNLETLNTTLSVVANAAGQASFNSPSFGLLSAARSARFMQLVARFSF